MRLPHIVVVDLTVPVFLNLTAFEMFHAVLGNEVTWYICFMDNIIVTTLEVSLLQWHGIILNAVGSDKTAAKLFQLPLTRCSRRL